MHRLLSFCSKDVFLWCICLIRLMHCLTIKIGLPYKPASALNGSLIITAGAIERLYTDQIISRNISFVIYDQLGCGIVDGPGAVFDLYTKYKFDVLLGPICTQGMVTTGLLATHWNIPALGYRTSGVEVSDKTYYRTLVRMVSSQESAALAVKNLLLQHNWRRIALVQLSPTGTIVPASFSCLLIANAIRTLLMSSTRDPQIVYDVTLNDTNFETVKKALLDIEKKTRVIVTCLRYKLAENANYNSRDFMLHAQTLNMTGPDYAYVQVLGYRTYMQNGLDPWTAAVSDNLDAAAKKAFQNVLLVESTLAELQRFVAADELITARSGQSMWSLPDPSLNSINWPLMYDAIYAFGLAMNATYANGAFNYTGEAIYQKSKCLDFYGMSGRVQLNALADRVGTYAVTKLDNKNNLIRYATLEPTVSCAVEDSDYKFLQLSSAYWQTSDGNPPPDTPVCGFHNENCESKLNGINYLWTIAIPAIIGLAGGAFVWRRHKRNSEDELYGKKWQINPQEIDYSPSYAGRRNDSISCVENETSIQESVCNESIGRKLSARSFLRCGHRIAVYREQTVSVTVYEKLRLVSLRREDLQQLKNLKDLRHENLNDFVGANLESQYPSILFLWDYCRRGSLEDILMHEDIQLDTILKASLMKDLLNGLEYMHRAQIVHGNLTTSSCVIDKRWILKLSNYGLNPILEYFIQQKSIIPKERSMKELYHFAPELLAKPQREQINNETMSQVATSGNRYGPATRASDIYSAGIILFLTVRRKPAEATSNVIPLTLNEQAACNRRPDLSLLAEADKDFKNIVELIRHCLLEESSDRPTVATVRKSVYEMTKQYSASIMDHIQLLMEQYTDNLERVVEERTREAVAERERADMILCQLLPRQWATIYLWHSADFFLLDLPHLRLDFPVTFFSDLLHMCHHYHLALVPFLAYCMQVERSAIFFFRFSAIVKDLKAGKIVTPETFESVSILFTDMVGFTKFCSNSTPLEVVGLLSALCSDIDEILNRFGVFKVETIGDAYFIASGLPVRNGDKHMTEISDVALEILDFIGQTFEIPHRSKERVQLRAGIHTGPVVAGVVGVAKPRYCVVGDTVNTASRMESTGEPMKVQISEATFTGLAKTAKYLLKYRGLINVKGKGMLQTYWLEGRLD